MKPARASRFLSDLHALEHFLRGSRPGFGRSLACLILGSLEETGRGQAALQSPMGELSRSVRTFVEAQGATSAQAMHLWACLERALAGCRAAVEGQASLNSVSSRVPRRPAQTMTGAAVQ